MIRDDENRESREESNDVVATAVIKALEADMARRPTELRQNVIVRIDSSSTTDGTMNPPAQYDWTEDSGSSAIKYRVSLQYMNQMGLAVENPFCSHHGQAQFEDGKANLILIEDLRGRIPVEAARVPKRVTVSVQASTFISLISPSYTGPPFLSVHDAFCIFGFISKL